MKNLSGGENEAENPIVAEFRKKFQYLYDDNQFADIKSYQEVKQFLLEKLASEYARGVREGEGTKNGVQRYQLGFADGQSEYKQFVLNILDGIDVADEQMQNKGGGTEAIRLAINSRII